MPTLNGYSLSILTLSLLNGLFILIINVINMIDYPENNGGTNWSGVLSGIESFIGIAVILLVGSSVGPDLCVLKIKDKESLRTTTIFYGILFLISIVIAAYRLGELGYLPTNGICVRTTGDLVCPTVIFRTMYDIDTKEDCVFNAFAENPDAWVLTGNNRLDWSNKKSYSYKKELFRVYNLSRPDTTIKSAADMVTFEDCYYWGCDPVCNDRYDYNVFLSWSSLISSILLFVTIILFIFLIDSRPMLVRSQTVSTNDPGADADDEAEDDEEEEDEEAPDEESEEEADSSDELLGKSDSFSGSKSWNFKLRM